MTCSNKKFCFFLRSVIDKLWSAILNHYILIASILIQYHKVHLDFVFTYLYCLFPKQENHSHFACSSVAQSCPTLYDHMDYSTPGFPVLHHLPEFFFKLMSIESVMPSNHLILCCPLFLQPSIFSRIRVFSNELVLHIRWPKYCSFSFSISPSNEYSGLISFRIDLLDLLAVQGTLKSLLQHHSSKASIIWHSAFFTVQLSDPYITRKTIALTRWTAIGKVISLLFDTLHYQLYIYLFLHPYCISKVVLKF